MSGIDALRMKQNLATMVAINTENPPGKEIEAAQCAAEWLEEFGFDVSFSEYAPARTNMIAVLENGEGPCFAFNTHLDVVPVGTGWSSNPFTLTERDGKLFGRGSCDAKGPMIGMIEAARILATSREKWRGTLMIVLTADEEVSSQGAKYYIRNHPAKIDFAVIGEPTSNAVFSAHKGSLRPVIKVNGVTAHSGTPDLGVNAIYKAGQLLGMVEQSHHEEVCTHYHQLVGNASLTVTRIHGGHADNVVPEACELMLDRRMVPGEDEEDVKQQIQQLLDVAKQQFDLSAEIVRWQPTTGGATETSADEKIVKVGLEACRRHGQSDAGPYGFQGGCDLVHFRTIGTKGIVIGPGDLAVAHKPDEFVPIEEFITCAAIYLDIAIAMMPVE